MSKSNTSPASTGAADDKANEPKADAKPAERKKMRVLDTTAVPGGANRHHEQIVDGIARTFIFEPGKGLELPAEIAVKFLKTDGFKLVDDDNNVVVYERPPRQPEDLGAGEKLVLAPNETVARYDELTNAALVKRAAPMPGGEVFARSAQLDRAAVIRFIMDTKAKLAAANVSKDKDIGDDEFLPPAETDEAA